MKKITLCCRYEWEDILCIVCEIYPTIYLLKRRPIHLSILAFVLVLLNLLWFEIFTFDVPFIWPTYELHPKPKLSIFCVLSQNYQFVLNDYIEAMKQIVWTQKWHYNFSRTSGFWVIKTCKVLFRLSSGVTGGGTVPPPRDFWQGNFCWRIKKK